MSEQNLLQELDARLRHQNTWRYVTSAGYFGTTATALLCSGGATLASAFGQAKYGAILAGSATVLLGLEKAMMFREKWSFHLRTWAKLDALRLEYAYGKLPEEDVAKRIGDIITAYSIGLPIAERTVDQSGDAPSALSSTGKKS